MVQNLIRDVVTKELQSLRNNDRPADNFRLIDENNPSLSDLLDKFSMKSLEPSRKKHRKVPKISQPRNLNTQIFQFPSQKKQEKAKFWQPKFRFDKNTEREEYRLNVNRTFYSPLKPNYYKLLEIESYERYDDVLKRRYKLKDFKIQLTRINRPSESQPKGISFCKKNLLNVKFRCRYFTERIYN